MGRHGRVEPTRQQVAGQGLRSEVIHEEDRPQNCPGKAACLQVFLRANLLRVMGHVCQVCRALHRRVHDVPHAGAQSGVKAGPELLPLCLRPIGIGRAHEEYGLHAPAGALHLLESGHVAHDDPRPGVDERLGAGKVAREGAHGLTFCQQCVSHRAALLSGGAGYEGYRTIH